MFLCYTYTISIKLWSIYISINCSKPAWKDGTTATVVVAINDLLYIASLGDSQVFYIFAQRTKVF